MKLPKRLKKLSELIKLSLRVFILVYKFIELYRVIKRGNKMKQRKEGLLSSQSSVTCPDCGGTGIAQKQTSMNLMETGKNRSEVINCPRCAGLKVVPLIDVNKHIIGTHQDWR